MTTTRNPSVNHPSVLCAITLAAALSACSGGGGGSTGAGTDTQVSTFGLLKPVESEAEIVDTMREGLAGVSLTDMQLELISSPGGDPNVGGDSGNFSTTNLQEIGVDEADRVKYDGDILYVLNVEDVYSGAPVTIDDSGISLSPGPAPASIRLFRTDAQAATVEEVANIEFESTGHSGDLYLSQGSTGKQLINVDSDTRIHNWGMFALDYHWQELATQVNSWNVEDPANPKPEWSVRIDGSLLTSRVVDKVLYLVTRYAPTVDGLLPYLGNEEERAANLALLQDVSSDDLLPNIVRDGIAAEELLSATDCYVPNSEYQGVSLPPVSGSLITVTAIDLEAPDHTNSICLNGFASGFYVSQTSLYITSHSGADQTLIHKVSLQNGDPEYRGSGFVPGYLGTNNPAFLMSESGDDLRVVSSISDSFALPVPDLVPEEASPQQTIDDITDRGRHFLTVLRENPDSVSLDAIAQIPNADRPEHIGKPGEDLYAARFMDDRAYLVTFETIDPFYVVDLANPQEPRIAGELELPGFSTLLQPLGEDLVLGVGEEVAVEQGAVLPQGVKVALFNVTNIDNPIELASETIGRRGSGSPALYDHHALTLLETDNIWRLALPVSRFAEEQYESSPWYDWSDDGLYLFEVNTATGSLVRSGTLISEQRSDSQQWPTKSLYGSRSVLHDDAVFFILGQDVLTGTWGM
jgi:beta propeller domain-containing protein